MPYRSLRYVFSISSEADLLHTFLNKTAPAGIEPAPSDRQSGVLTAIL